ncbi:MAG: PAS domain-containing protein [Pirellulales bacterium]
MRSVLKKLLAKTRCGASAAPRVERPVPTVRGCDDISRGEVDALRTLAIHSPDPIYISNTRGDVLIANTAFAELLGTNSVEELLRIGAANANGMYVDSSRAAVVYDGISQSADTRRFVSQIRTRGGDTLWIEESLCRYETSTGEFLLISAVREMRRQDAPPSRPNRASRKFVAATRGSVSTTRPV